MLSESFQRAKKSNYKEEELWKMKMRVLEREEDIRRKFHIFHIEKVRTTKWKSLEQIKVSIQKDNLKKSETEDNRLSVISNLTQRDNGDGLESRISSLSTRDVFTRKEKKPKKIEIQDWAKYSYEKYLSMLDELEITLKMEPEEIVEEIVEKMHPDIPDMIIPEIIIQPYTDSESEEDIEITYKETKEKKWRKKMSKPKNIDFGRIKYMKNLKQIKSIKFTNK